jgi:hypothetical protein
LRQGRIETWKTVRQFGPALAGFLSKDTFASARIIAAHFGVAPDSVKMNLVRELGLWLILKVKAVRSAE